MKKESYIAAAALLAVVALIGAGCSDSGGNRPMIASSEPEQETQIELVEDISTDEEVKEIIEEDEQPDDDLDSGWISAEEEENTIEENSIPSMIGNRNLFVAEKIGFTTTVSVENTQSKERTALFSFDENWEFDPSSGNTYERQEAAVDYSPVHDQFAYIQDNEIYTYDVATGTTTALLTKTGEYEGRIDGINIPVWNVEGLPQGTMSLFSLEYSPDGSKLAIASAFYEGLTHSVMDLENNTVTHMQGANFLPFVWSPDGTAAVIAVPRGAMASPGLFVATDNNFADALNVWQHEYAISVESAVWLEDNTLIVVHQNTTDQGEFIGDSLYYIGHFNPDGTYINSNITKSTTKPTIELADGMKVYMSHYSKGQRTHSVIDATDYSTDVVVGGTDNYLTDVDSEKSLLVHNTRFEEDDIPMQSFVVYSFKGQHLYQTQLTSEGALSFIDWK